MSATKIQVGKTKATPNDTLKHTTGREDGEDLLMLELLGGKDLLVMDKNDKSDPFVITRVLDKSEEEKISSKLLNGDSCGFMKKNCYRSSICFQTLFPQWNESYSLWIPQKAQENLVVRFDVFDWDRIGRDYMGKVIIPVQDLIKYTSPTTLCLDIDVEGVKQRKKIRENGGQLEVQAVLVPGKNLERHYLVAEKHIGGLQELFFRRPFSVQVVSRVAYSETSDEMASAVCELAAAADSLRDVVRELVTINVEATNQVYSCIKEKMSLDSPPVGVHKVFFISLYIGIDLVSNQLYGYQGGAYDTHLARGGILAAYSRSFGHGNYRRFEWI